MPIYEYRCKKCNTDFTVLKMSSRQEETACPACGSRDVARKLSSFSCSASSGGFSGGGFSGGGFGGG